MQNINSSNAPESAPVPIAAPSPSTTGVSSYQAPAIESIIAPDDLQREVLYAGMLVSDPNSPA